MPFDPRLSVCGFVVGAVVGMTGMGGGSLMTALLILVFGIHPLSAVGTDLLYAAGTKVVGAGVHSFNRNVDLEVCGLLATGSLPAVVGVIMLLSRLPAHHPGLDRAITLGIGSVLVVAAIAMLVRSRVMAIVRSRGASRQGRGGWHCGRSCSACCSGSW